MKNKNTKWMTIIMGAMILATLASDAHSLCVKDCEMKGVRPRFDTFTANSGMSPYRERSHNTGDVKNSVMGDVNIKVGHEKLNINIDSKGDDHMVDASINSTIILGDMSK